MTRQQEFYYTATKRMRERIKANEKIIKEGGPKNDFIARRKSIEDMNKYYKQLLRRFADDPEALEWLRKGWLAN